MRPSTTVYSYYLPTVREAVEEAICEWDHDLLLQNIHPSLDDLHVPVFDLFTQRVGSTVEGWENFPNRYWTNGSSEGLFHLIALLGGPFQREVGGAPLYQLDGEYQGYQQYAKSLGYEITTLDRRKPEYAKQTSVWSDLEPGVFFLSNPSAVDGNILDKDLFAHIVDNHTVVLDLAYLGMTDPFPLDISHPNILAVVCSLSKPFGLYYYRCGFTFSRGVIPSLYANKWFKNAFSIQLAKEVLETVNPYGLGLEQRERQEAYCKAAERDLQVKGIKPADVWLLANSKYYGHPDYKRGHTWRYCLTPYVMEAEQDARSELLSQAD